MYNLRNKLNFLAVLRSAAEKKNFSDMIGQLNGR